MSHYQERLEQDLAKIRHEIDDVGHKVGKAVHDAVRALLTRDHALGYATALGDHPINRQVRRLDRECHAFVARHLPSAGHLRFISSVLRLNIELERIGDYAANIGRQATQLRRDAPAAVARDVEVLSSQAEDILKQSLKAFLTADADLARATRGTAAQVAKTFTKFWNDLLAEGTKGQHPLEDIFVLLEVFERLSRVSDQAKNICEETIFTVTGETKPPKVYRVLFVDEKDDSLTQMAVAYARKAFPNSGRYTSAGLEPASEIEPRCARFLDEHGYDAADLQPTRLDTASDELASYHVVVGFGDDLARQIQVPFHTILLEWDAAALPHDAGAERAAELLAEAHQAIRHQVRGLMETLRGEEAD